MNGESELGITRDNQYDHASAHPPSIPALPISSERDFVRLWESWLHLTRSHIDKSSAGLGGRKRNEVVNSHPRFFSLLRHHRQRAFFMVKDGKAHRHWATAVEMEDGVDIYPRICTCKGPGGTLGVLVDTYTKGGWPEAVSLGFSFGDRQHHMVHQYSFEAWYHYARCVVYFSLPVPAPTIMIIFWSQTSPIIVEVPVIIRFVRPSSREC